VVERGVQLVHRVRAEGVADLGPVARHPHGAGVHRVVIGAVDENPVNAAELRIEDLRTLSGTRALIAAERVQWGWLGLRGDR
jgi:hypothetical protein